MFNIRVHIVIVFFVCLFIRVGSWYIVLTVFFKFTYLRIRQRVTFEIILVSFLSSLDFSTYALCCIFCYLKITKQSKVSDRNCKGVSKKSSSNISLSAFLFRTCST